MEQRCFIINARKWGLSYTDIKDEFYEEYERVTYDSTISDLMKKEIEIGSLKDRPRPSRPPIYDKRDERIIVKFTVKNPIDSLWDLENSTKAKPKDACKDTLNIIYRSMT